MAREAGNAAENPCWSGQSGVLSLKITKNSRGSALVRQWRRMGFLRRLAGIVGFILFLTPCVIVGVYAGRLNTASTLAGWGVGIGVAVAEAAIILFLAAKKTQQNLFLAIAAILVGALPSYYWIQRPLSALRPFKSHLTEYLKTASNWDPEQFQAARVGPVKGKMIPVDMKSKDFDPVFFDLSTDLRPKNPDEIRTVAGLWWEERQVGTYGGKGGAYQEHCTVLVLDKATGELLASESFIGSMPPSKSQNGASQTGDKPYREIREFLNGLPHQ
jgi:hypothetical protein